MMFIPILNINSIWNLIIIENSKSLRINFVYFDKLQIISKDNIKKYIEVIENVSCFKFSEYPINLIGINYKKLTDTGFIIYKLITDMINENIQDCLLIDPSDYNSDLTCFNLREILKNRYNDLYIKCKNEVFKKRDTISFKRVKAIDVVNILGNRTSTLNYSFNSRRKLNNVIDKYLEANKSINI